MIAEVLFEDIPQSHDDDRRTLSPVFNSDVPGFRGAAQLKVATMKQDGFLGRHFHTYAELFCVLSGEAVFTLTFAGTDSVPQTKQYALVPGKRLLIPAGVHHTAEVKAGTILIGLTEEKYISPAENDHH